jgi:hypothetical protein
MVSATELQSNKSAALVWIFNAFFLGAGNVYAAGWQSSKLLWFGVLYWFFSARILSVPSGGGFGLWLILYMALSIYGVIQVSSANNALNKKKVFSYMNEVSSVEKNRSLQATNLSDRSPYATAQFEAKLKAADRNRRPPKENYGNDTASMPAAPNTAVGRNAQENSGYTSDSDPATTTQMHARTYNQETARQWQETRGSGINAANYMEPASLASHMVSSQVSLYESASNTVSSDTIQDRPVESLADTLQLKGRELSRTAQEEPIAPAIIPVVTAPQAFAYASINASPSASPNDLLNTAAANPVPPPIPVISGQESHLSCTRCGQPREHNFSFCMSCGHSYGIG